MSDETSAGKTNEDDQDDMLRVAGSLKLGWVTASLFVQKLQAFRQRNALTQALQEYGRLIRTLHILRWYDDETGRRRINRQLNKGESVHSLTLGDHHCQPRAAAA